MNLILVAVLTVGWLAPGPLLDNDGNPLPPCCQAKQWTPLTGEPTFAESTHSYDVRHYRIDFDLPMYHAGYSAREQISLASREPQLDTVRLDFAALTCDSVLRTGTPLTFTVNDSQLLVSLDTPLPQGDSTVIDVFFHRDSTTPNRGYFYGRPPSIRYAHAMTCGCPRDNHYWFACFDHPMDKAERGVEINLTVPDTFQTCSNGMLDSVTAGSDGTATYWWRHTYPIATYLMTFSASRFTSWDTLVATPAGDSVPLIHFMWPEDSAATRNGYRRLPEMLSYFADNDLFGPYPFDKYGHVPGYYGFPWGGMEHQTMVMLHTTYIGGGHESTIAHELSHMWWGDMVTHVGYADVWLNEGFGTYAECICMGHLNGRSYFNTFIQGKANSYISRDRAVRMPIYDPPWHLIYDYGHIYCKGAWVQHMLRWVLCDTTWAEPGIFFEAQRAYADSFPYGTVSTDDYQRVVEGMTGLDLDWFFDEWIRQAGYPKYHMTWSREETGDSFRVVTILSQNNGAQAPDYFQIPLPVRINCLDIDTLVAIRPSANPQVDTFIVGSCPDSLTIDPDNWVLDSAYLTGIDEPPGPEPATPRIGVGPNPARETISFSLPPGPPASIDVLDEAGRIVASLSTVNGRAEWNLRDHDDRRVSAGIYFARCPVGRSFERHKLVVTD